MKLRAAREAAGLTQKQAADKAQIAERVYQAYEYDEREPGVRAANRIARVVNSTTEDLWGFGAATPKQESD